MASKWLPMVVEDLSNDWALLDDTFVLLPPPEYKLPAWNNAPELEDWSDTHDWTMDYDYPDWYSEDDPEYWEA